MNPGEFTKRGRETRRDHMCTPFLLPCDALCPKKVMAGCGPWTFSHKNCEQNKLTYSFYGIVLLAIENGLIGSI